MKKLRNMFKYILNAKMSRVSEYSHILFHVFLSTLLTKAFRVNLKNYIVSCCFKQIMKLNDWANICCKLFAVKLHKKIQIIIIIKKNLRNKFVKGVVSQNIRDVTMCHNVLIPSWFFLPLRNRDQSCLMRVSLCESGVYHGPVLWMKYRGFFQVRMQQVD